MAHFLVEPFTFFELQEKVVVLTGGANGIGAATVRLLHEHGACVFFGDLDAEAGTALASSFSDNQVHFVPTDASSYTSILGLFKQAHSHRGRVNHAFSVAGISEQSTWFHQALTIEAVETCPDLKTMHVNLTGALYFAHIAAAYMKQTEREPNEVSKTLVLVSSVAGFTESSGLPVYAASKHGVLGLMRSLRTSLPTTHGISVSAVCPWMSLTGMASSIAGEWQRAGLAMNSAEDVAKVIVGLAAMSDDSNGKAVYVEGGRGWDIEEGLDRTREEWMGMEQSVAWEKGQEFLRSHKGSPAYWATKTPETQSRLGP